MKPHELQILVTVSIAVGTVIIVPVVTRIWRAFREAQQARLAKVFALREDLDAKFEELQVRQERQHAENREVLDRIRTEAHAREGKILGSLQAVSNRVDRVFERMAGGAR